MIPKVPKIGENLAQKMSVLVLVWNIAQVALSCFGFLIYIFQDTEMIKIRVHVHDGYKNIVTVIYNTYIIYNLTQNLVHRKSLA